MGSTYLTELVDWCVQEGLHVVEIDGWEQRARGSGGYEPGRPWAIMWHHTASKTSPENDANYMCYGSLDAPIANVLLARDGAVWVLAAVATNTNGKGRARTFSKGTVPADSMNSYGFGIEIANNGVGEAYPQAQIDAAFVLSNMLCRRLGLKPSDVCTHQDYAPDRKIDPATASAVQGPWQPSSINSSGTWSQPDLQDEAIDRVGVEIPEEPEAEVQVCEVAVDGIDARFLGYKVKQGGIDFILWVEWVNGADPNQLARLESYRSFDVPTFTMQLIDMRGVGLIGPVPSGDKTHNWQRSDFGNVIG